MSETQAPYTVGDPVDETQDARLARIGKQWAADIERRNPEGMKPTLAEWEVAGLAYQAAVDREDVDAMRAADEAFWELAGRLKGVAR